MRNEEDDPKQEEFLDTETEEISPYRMRDHYASDKEIADSLERSYYLSVNTHLPKD